MNTLAKKTKMIELVREDQSEQLLLERLEQATTEEDYFRWLLFVVGFYRGVNKLDAAKGLLEQYLQAGDNPQQIAHCYLALGQIETDEQQFDRALAHFTSAMSLEPEKTRILYVLHNNAGYCLNALGRYTEAEWHCRLAIDLDAARASAYRNLGVSLQGTGNILGAAWAFFESVKAETADDRARLLLEQLVTENPGLIVRCPWLADGLCEGLEMPAEMPV